MMVVVEIKCTMLHMYFPKFPLPKSELPALLRAGLLCPWCTVHRKQARHFVLHNLYLNITVFLLRAQIYPVVTWLYYVGLHENAKFFLELSTRCK